jgi:AmmeMemoRadiSam system protein B
MTVSLQYPYPSMTAQRIKKSVIAGSWYPGDPRALREEIERFFSAVPERPIEGDIIGIIAPHAGYDYSGEVAAHAYRQLRGNAFDAVIVIGPSHRNFFRGVSVYPAGGYETPLGVVPIDETLAADLIGSGPIVSGMPEVHTQEHSVEIQLPFLQAALGGFKFVPLIMGDQNRDTCEKLAGAIVRAAETRKVLIVGSSDLSHYHTYEKAVVMDRRALDDLVRMDAAGLLEDLEAGFSEACGGGPAAVTVMAAQKLGADRAELMKYANSGDVTGDRSSVVGYASVAFFRAGIKKLS